MKSPARNPEFHLDRINKQALGQRRRAESGRKVETAEEQLEPRQGGDCAPDRAAL